MPLATTDTPSRRGSARRHRDRAAPIVAVALLCASVLSACLGTPGDITQVQLVSSVTDAGWRYDYYRNTAYPCAISGYQTFLIGTKVGSDPAATRPLWVKMHGGGAGYFDSAGNPVPTINKTEEPRSRLLDAADSGLSAMVMNDPAGVRFLAVSMCSHDVYAGANTPDVNNPNTLPDGTPITTNGLLATKAAIQYTESQYPTDDRFLHGGSAGSAGSFHVAWALDTQGLAPAGIVADSGIINQTWEQAQMDQGLPCALAPEAAALMPTRWHPEIAYPAHQPDLLVANGRLTVPIMHVWNKGDTNVCGTTPMQCERRDGSVVTMGSASCVHDPMRLAIEGLGETSRSRSMGLCVDNPAKNEGLCDRHVVTGHPTALNTDPAEPADYRAAIMTWVRERLADD